MICHQVRLNKRALEPPTMTSAASKLAQIPELVAIIFESLQKGDLLRLSTVSRLFFLATAPYIWESVGGARPLLQLLSGCLGSEGKFEPKGGEKYHGHFTFYRPLSEADFTRFDLYAPYVKKIDLFSRQGDFVLVNGWEMLINYVRSGHMLLPALTTLVLDPPRSFGPHHLIHPYLWVSVLHSPSLKSILIGQHLGPITPTIGPSLLHLLAKSCPNLSNLKFPMESWEYNEFDRHKAMLSHIPKYNYRPRLLQPVLPARRRMPLPSVLIKEWVYRNSMNKLESLEACDKIEGGFSKDDMSTRLLSAPFPKLSALALGHVDRLALVNMIRDMAPLFATITTLELLILPRAVFAQYDDVTENFPGCLLSMLPTTTPNVTRLDLHFSPEDDDDDETNAIIDEGTLKMLAILPLKELVVHCAAIRCGSVPEQGSPAACCKLLASTFPNLEKLVWMSQSADWDDLVMFSGMPNLVHLGLRLYDINVPAHAFTEQLPRGKLRAFEDDLDRECPFSGDLREIDDWFLFAK
ncbi:F-box protein [Ceratobasidium sp. AG-Ba]|nr:F-box protein [Ceratobasidium sp. AG-Ba]